MKRRTIPLHAGFALVVLLVPFAALCQAAADGIPRTPDGRPDLSGTYNIATLTPLERPERFGDELWLTPEEAAEIEANEQALIADRGTQSDGEREAPPEGGDGSPGAAGNVGGYNYFWIDRGTDVFAIDGRFRTSIVTDPPNGRRPETTPAAKERAAMRAKLFPTNEGRAFWLGEEGPGPYDHMEQRPLAERCIVGFGSAAGPPMLPAAYNNLKTIVQTEDHVMILVEMVHDARVVRLNSEHVAPDVRRWLGDSIGWWEGDTLVVDTTNFNDTPALTGASRDLHVVERFRRLDADHLLYSFTVEDPGTWEGPWSGEVLWPGSDERLFEYACHEGNYALGNIMRGARLLESEWPGD